MATEPEWYELAGRLTRERNDLRAALAEAEGRIKHMSEVLVDAESLLGVEETGELILRPIERLQADLANAVRERDDCCVLMKTYAEFINQRDADFAAARDVIADIAETHDHAKWCRSADALRMVARAFLERTATAAAAKLEAASIVP